MAKEFNFINVIESFASFQGSWDIICLLSFIKEGKRLHLPLRKQSR